MDLLRQIVASPRARHDEAGLDLCYVTDNIIATSGPSGTYPQLAYRNPLKDLVKFLDSKHKENWSIWEFRAEGTGYPDEEVYGRIRHYPWPDHHPPPFALVPLIMGSMKQWLKDKEKEGRVAVVHCKAGKGRSGTISCSYLISEEGWAREDAMKRFTDRRMRPGFGNGISIPSQIRTLMYVERWTNSGKKPYVDRPTEIVELHVWGLRDGVKIGIEGYVDEGKIIKCFHTFHKDERKTIRGEIRKDTGFADVAMELMGKKKAETAADAGKQVKQAEKAEEVVERKPDDDDRSGGDVVFVPKERIVLPSSDVNVDFERRNKSKYGGFTMVTSVAHVWFNTFFEGNGPEQDGKPDDSGVFTIDFDAMDGIKGSSRKGTKCFDKIQVVWKAVDLENKPAVTVTEPSGSTESIPQARPADWKGGNDKHSNDIEKKLGLREADSASADISRASSMKTDPNSDKDDVKDERETVQSVGPDGKALHETTAADVSQSKDVSKNPSTASAHSSANNIPATSSTNTRSAPTQDSVRNEITSSATTDGTSDKKPLWVDQRPQGNETGQSSSPTVASGEQTHVSTADLPGGVPEEQLGKHHEHGPGHLSLNRNTKPSSS
ncbi:Phosphatidylinositol 3,4,5-trisphosphate 3-phosphatase and dual-specificity protein phosphatase PTEN [Cercospora beticola]|uniref:phosphatidylinositol-3,4,5-trisphosphate 3-phosphatase n=1 Tax=Cercospora beticola TaxID=122368 RepID=A0A2G5I380_CERBT|nr:Phosphatidylinositol 3,4,5-trisphosphate 3-phosphatase and dual-specificity protein phosphatase PTEN [Cercospora beticola]PIA99276.1 Phosphatidylinositol 3,4,5-trisphosphate 3-phosphatase and dual-specificity protein phosphatase PTEN [Cercospora beticola]WPB00755.1 hypothetical protein RHO25_005375 [Cercospora beticola]CAK1361010.1 unnamed protein product [Cercospora beticola]